MKIQENYNRKDRILKDIIFLLFFIVINAFIHNMLKYFLVFSGDMTETVKALFHYVIIISFLITTFTTLISINVFELSINYTLLSAWVCITYSMIIIGNVNNFYKSSELRIMLTVCIINLVSSILMYLILKNKQVRH